MKLSFAPPHVGPVAAPDSIRAVATQAETMGYRLLWTLEWLLKPVQAKTIPDDRGRGRSTSSTGRCASTCPCVLRRSPPGCGSG